MMFSYLSSLAFSLSLGYLVFVSAPATIFFVVYPAFSLFRGVSQPATSSIIAALKTSDVRTGFSLLAIGGNLGFAIGPAIAGPLAGHYGYAAVFLLSASASAIVFFLTLFKIQGGKRYSVSRARVRRSLKWVEDKYIILFLALIFCLYLSVGYEITPLSLYAARFLSLSPDLIGYLFATNGIVIVILQLPLTKLTERSKTLLLPLVISACLTAASLFIASSSRTFAQLELTMFVITLGEIFLTVPSQTIIALFSTGGNRGTYQGYYSAASSSGRSVASFVGPLSFSIFSSDLPVAWYLIAAFCILTGVGIAFLAPRFQKEYEKVDRAFH